MAVLDLDPRINPALGYPRQIVNDAIAVSDHPMEMAGSSPAMTLVGPLRVVRQQLGRLVLATRSATRSPFTHVPPHPIPIVEYIRT